MKTLFYFFIILSFLSTSHLYASIEELIETEDYVENAEASVSDVNFKNFNDEIKYIEDNSKKLEEFLNKEESPSIQSKNDEDSVSLTSSAIKKNTVSNDEESVDLNDLINPKVTPLKVRRVRSR